MTEPGNNYRQQDYFVLDAGTAQREAGFHHMLAEYIGWHLPPVRRYDGSETILYLETIFPLYMSSKNLVGRRFRPHFQRISKYATWGDARLNSYLRWKRMKSNSNDNVWSWNLHQITLHGQRSGTTYLQLPLW